MMAKGGHPTDMTKPTTMTRPYPETLEQLRAVLDGENDPVLWMSTAVALLKQELGYFWVGFYLARGETLSIGPYQGSLACLHIAFSQGVCGACARRRETIIVPDVHQFEGHIACDSRSESEIVVPVFDSEGNLRAVLDVDSDRLDDFDERDQKYLEALVSEMKDLSWGALS